MFTIISYVYYHQYINVSVNEPMNCLKRSLLLDLAFTQQSQHTPADGVIKKFQLTPPTLA